MKTFQFFPILLFAVLFSCSDSPKVDWNEIDRIVCSSPQEGLHELEKIPVDGLSKADKERYNLLMIKSRDKLFITHTTDTVILEVIDYYSNNDRHLYPEALYYGGRVYSDLGDKPSAIKYYQSALNILPENEKNIDLRSNLLSQIAQEYLFLSLHDEALIYLEKVVKCDSIKNDSINIAFDYGMIGEIYQRQKNPDKAELYYKKGLRHLADHHKKDKSFILISLAKVQLQKNNIDSAKIQIDKIITETADIDTADSQQSDLRNSALSTAVQTYYKTGDFRAAYTHARELALSNSPLNRQTGFYILFKPEVMKYIPTDSLVFFIKEYHKTLETRYKEHDAQQVVMQNSRYNYETHERERLKAELREQKALGWLAVAIIAALLLLTSALYYLDREKTRLIELHKVVEDMEAINKIIMIDPASTNKMTQNQSSELSEAKERLIETLVEKVQKNETVTMSNDIVNSDVVIKLKDDITDGNIPDNLPWDELNDVVKQAYPQFVIRLRFLSNGEITADEIKHCMLIKCGFTPGDISSLLHLKKNTLSYRRKKLCKLLSDKRLDTAKLDDMINLL